MRVCTRCNQRKPAGEFSRNAKGPGGRCWQCKACDRAKFVANPDLNRRSWLKLKYGITVEQYDAMLSSQAGVCRICDQPCTKGRRLSVDHDHTTGAVRGLLCARCNTSLERIEAVPNWAERATEYLAGSQPQH